MKHKHLILGWSLIIVLALLILNAGVVLASRPVLDLSEDSAAAGTTVTISGDDFSPGYYYYIFFDNDYKAQGFVNVRGRFTEDFTIPSAAEDGEHEITIGANATAYTVPDIDNDFAETACAGIQVISGKITLDPSSGQPGSSVTVRGSGFSGRYYYIFFDGEYKIHGGLSDDGAFTSTLVVPFLADNRTYNVVAAISNSSRRDPDLKDDYDEEAIAGFEVDAAEADIDISNNMGHVGDKFTLSGSGFRVEKPLTVYWDNRTLVSQPFLSDASGNFTAEEYSVPESPYGSHTVKVIDSTGKYDALGYTVTPRITLSRTLITGGNTLTVSGTGFQASSPVSFYVDSTLLSAGAITSDRGTLSGTEVALPALSADKYVFKVKDGEGYSARTDINIDYPVPARASVSSQAVRTDDDTLFGHYSTLPTTPSVPAQTTAKTASASSLKWVIILIAVCCVAVAVLLLWLKRKHKKVKGK